MKEASDMLSIVSTLTAKLILTRVHDCMFKVCRISQAFDLILWTIIFVEEKKARKKGVKNHPLAQNSFY